MSSYYEHGRMVGSEYQFNAAGPHSLRDVYQHNVPCAVCYVPTRAATIMVPAETVCPSSWTTEYSGYLTSEGEASAEGIIYHHTTASMQIQTPSRVQYQWHTVLLCPVYLQWLCLSSLPRKQNPLLRSVHKVASYSQ